MRLDGYFIADIGHSLALSVNALGASILMLCVVAGVGTILLLPGRREPAIRKLGGVVLLAAGLVAMALIAHATSEGGGDFYFWAFSLVAILSSIRVISHPKPVYSALYFVLAVMASAGLFVLLWAEFMAAALVMIYAGAILVTYVFVIMLASQARGELSPGQDPDAGGAEYDKVSREPLAAAAVGFALMGMLLFVIFDKMQLMSPERLPAAAETYSDQSTVQALGAYLFTAQSINLELAGVILTLAMVGAIVIARRRVVSEAAIVEDVVVAKLTPINDDPHSIPVYGTQNPQAKAYPER